MNKQIIVDKKLQFNNALVVSSRASSFLGTSQFTYLMSLGKADSAPLSLAEII